MQGARSLELFSKVSESATFALRDDRPRFTALEADFREPLPELRLRVSTFKIDEVPEAIPGTCEWIRSHHKFKEWFESREDAQSILLLTGNPWCGKSVFVRYLVEKLADLPEIDTCCYSFHQTVGKKSEYKNKFNLLDEIFTLENQPGLSLDAESRCSKTIYCIIDALDECSPDDIPQFVQKLQDYIESRQLRRERVKFLITARPHACIFRSFKDTSSPGNKITLYCKAMSWGDEAIEQMQTDISEYIAYQLDRIKYRGDARILISLLLDKNSQSSYLWPSVVFDVLNELHCNSLRTKQWGKVINALEKQKLSICKELLEPSSIKGKRICRPRFDGHEHPLYKTARQLLRFHFQGVLGNSDRPLSRFRNFCR
jgi:hypothetical protein